MAKKKATPPKRLSRRALRESLEMANEEMALAETQYTTQMLKEMMLVEANPFIPPGESDDSGWSLISSGANLVANKQQAEARDPATVRAQSYRMWRFHPQGRGILRNFTRFIIGREFSIDFEDLQHGKWSADKKKLQVTNDENDPLITSEAWKEFERNNQFILRRKEIVLRVFRDGEVFIQRFPVNGRVLIRFVEPEKVDSGSDTVTGTVQETDLPENDPLAEYYRGKPTAIKNGIEYLADDQETVVAYHVSRKKNGETVTERVPAKDMIHAKAFADANDLRGFPLLEVVAKTLTNYESWEQYRMILNKVRTAIALVRKVEGTAAQARKIIDNRGVARQSPDRLEPQTVSGRREAMFRAGTVLTPGPGVSYDFMSPKLDARDAGEDGRRFLLSVAAGVGLPEMLVTADWSNSNYSSAVESRTPAVREWEDWQDFFELVFKRIVQWVIEEGIKGLGLPEETSSDCNINWPQLISKDAAKETARNMNIFNGGILSRQTWAAREELNYDDELEKMRDEAEAILMAPVHASIPDQVRLNMTTPPTPGVATGTPVAGAGTQDPNAQPVQPNDVTGAAGSKPGPTIEAKNIFLKGLRDLRESVDDIEDEDVKNAVKQYIWGVAKLIKQRD